MTNLTSIQKIKQSIKRFPRYKENLKLVNGTKIYSYDTHVATIIGDARGPQAVKVHGWWSMTTSKHINYVAQELGLPVKKYKK